MKHPGKTRQMVFNVSAIAFMCAGVLLLLNSRQKTGYIGTLKDLLGDIFPITILTCFLAGYLIWHSRIKLAARTFMTLPILAIGAPFVGLNGGFFNFGFRFVRFLTIHPAVIGIPAALTVGAITLSVFRRSVGIGQSSRAFAGVLPQIVAAGTPGYPRAADFGVDVDCQPIEASVISKTVVSQTISADLRQRMAKYEWTGDVDLKDIYGYVRFIENMKADIERYMTDRERASRYVKQYALKAYLLYGPGGTGKSHAARCFAGHVADEYGFIVFDVKNSRQLQGSNWQASLKALTEFLDTVKECRDEGFRVCIIWDEVDGFCASDLPSDAKRVAAMKVAFDDWSNQAGPPMIFLATTNEPQEFTEEMMRPGRLTPIFFPPPDVEARSAIIGEHLRSKNLLPGERAEITLWVAQQSERATVSELLSYLDTIGMSAYERAKKARRDIPIRLQDFQKNNICARDYDVFLKKMQRKFAGRHSHKLALFTEMANSINEFLKYSEQNIER